MDTKTSSKPSDVKSPKKSFGLYPLFVFKLTSYVVSFEIVILMLLATIPDSLMVPTRDTFSIFPSPSTSALLLSKIIYICPFTIKNYQFI